MKLNCNKQDENREGSTRAIKLAGSLTKPLRKTTMFMSLAIILLQSISDLGKDTGG